MPNHMGKEDSEEGQHARRGKKEGEEGLIKSGNGHPGDSKGQ